MSPWQRKYFSREEREKHGAKGNITVEYISIRFNRVKDIPVVIPEARVQLWRNIAANPCIRAYFLEITYPSPSWHRCISWPLTNDSIGRLCLLQAFSLSHYRSFISLSDSHESGDFDALIIILSNNLNNGSFNALREYLVFIVIEIGTKFMSKRETGSKLIKELLKQKLFCRRKS